MQVTLGAPFSVSGVGLHSGARARLSIRPAPGSSGIVFERADLGGLRIPARADLVECTPLCTRLVAPGGASISTVEHVLAALAGCGVSNAVVVVDGPEVPILDGSALPFVEKIKHAGLRVVDVPQDVLVIQRPVRVSLGQAWAEIRPLDGFRIRGTIAFEEAAIGMQSMTYEDRPGAFSRRLAGARTFCRRQDIEAMQNIGLARGGDLDNAVVVDGDRVLNPDGLRMEREFIRHKILDVIGDLSLVGMPIRGEIEVMRPGHALNNLLARAVLENPGVATTRREVSKRLVRAAA